jgi:hypothetical protein
MEQQSEEVKRAVRTALRAIEAAETDLPADESSEHMAAAIQQLTFAVDKLIGLMLQAKSGQN